MTEMDENTELPRAKKITIVQYLRPYGRKKMISNVVPEELGIKVEAIQDRAFEISMKVLTTGNVAMYVSDTETDLEAQICENGPEIEKVFEEMINRFYEKMTSE